MIDPLSKFNRETKKNILSWLNDNFDEEIKNEIKNLLKTDPSYLKDAFSKKLSFGTGGVRAKMGIGTNRLNKYTIRMAAQGLASYLKKEVKTPSCLIGYDNRNNSKFFAEESAKVLASNNIKVFLFKDLRPTPLVSFGCREKKTSCAIMITASHNPPEYNGFKIYWEDGAQVVFPHDKQIIEEIEKIKDPSLIKTTNLKNSLIEIIDDEIDKKYIQKLSSLITFKNLIKEKGKSLKIIYSNIHGTGITILPKALEKEGFTNFHLVEKQSTIDGNFPYAKIPNPEEKKTLELGISKMLKENADIFIATDPDADRLAIVVNKNQVPFILSGNQIASILLEYIIFSLKSKNQLPKNAAFIKTIVTTELFKKICENKHLFCFDLLTGFKYIAEKIRIWENESSYKFIFGAEESYGYLLKDFVRDKDSISAALIASELALLLKTKKKTLIDFLYEIYKKYGTFRETLLSISFENKEKEMTQLMESLRKNPPKTFSKYKIVIQEDYLKKEKIDLKTLNKTPLTLPKSDVLRYFLEDGSKVVIRPSGTETKMKIYIGVSSENKNIEEAILKCDKKIKDLTKAIEEKVKI